MAFIASGHWVYTGSITCGVRISVSSRYYGTGDWEDEPEFRDDRDETTYVLEYQLVADAEKWAGGGQFRTIESAKAAARAVLGPTLEWHVDA